jgi:glycosyltransferase involved in cell wall biosynthesis
MRFKRDRAGGIDPSGAPIRVGIVLRHPAQHFVEAFRSTQSSDIVDPTVFYWTMPDSAWDEGFDQEVSWDLDLASGYRWWTPQDPSATARSARQLWRQLGATAPEVLIIFGWSTTIARLSLLWAIASRTPYLVYGDSTWQHATRPRIRILRSAILRLLFATSSGALSTGTFNREFYIQHGIHPARVHDGVCPADVDFYRAGARSADRAHAPFVIGFAGKMIERKGLDELLEALSRLADRTDWRALVVGDGPLRPSLERLAADFKVDDRVDFVGFRNTSEMPKLLGSCDVVVIPSKRDLRVLVAIEAMAAGAVVIASSATAVWGRGDLIEHEVTGMVYRSGDPAQLASTLSRLLDDPALVERLRQAGMTRADDSGPQGFRTSLEIAVSACAR